MPYEILLEEAINKVMLVPVHYYAINDATDYFGLHLVKSNYIESALTALYREYAERYDLIYKYYMKYRSSRALRFYYSRQHAKEMEKEFCRRGVPSVAVYSDADGAFSEDRDIVLERLKKEIRVIFSRYK